MSDQLQLDIRERIAYSAKNFVPHSGVIDCFRTFQESVCSNAFRVLFVEAGRRAGKTHFAIACSDWCARHDYFPRLVDGLHFADWLDQDVVRERSVVIVDDAHLYLRETLPGNSGKFVSFIERHRVAGSTVVLLSGLPYNDLPCDEHVLSRVLPGTGNVIAPPAETEVQDILRRMAIQRGMRLSDRKLTFVTRRIARDIQAMEDYLDRVYQLSRRFGKSAQFPVLNDAL